MTGTENEVKNPKLAAFTRVHLQPNQEVRIDIHVAKDAFSTINNEGEKVFDGTGAKVYVGFGQPDKRTEQLRADEVCVLNV